MWKHQVIKIARKYIHFSVDENQQGTFPKAYFRGEES